VTGGRRADVWRNRFGATFYTGAQWATPHAWITGEATSREAAEAELASIRTARVPTP
jgi:hypothetical protein